MSKRKEESGTLDKGAAMQRLFEIMKDIDFCMLTTFEARDQTSTRPMSTIVKVDEHLVYMLSEKDGKVDAIAKKPRVILGYSDGGKKFAVLEGEAKIRDDRALVEALWTPGAQAFWPQGPKDPSIVAIEVKPIAGEYWDGHNALISTWKFATSIATGETADMGDHETVAFKASRRRA